MMLKKYMFLLLMTGLAVIVGLDIMGCGTGVESSPDPGILRITLEADPADTTIIIVSDTFTVEENDTFFVTIFQGRAFHDSLYAVLFPSIRSTRQQDIAYNIIDKKAGVYTKYRIFETHVPPYEYDRIQFGLRSNILKFSNFDIIQVESQPGTNPLVDLEQKFEIHENRVTEMNVRIKPFESIERYRDIYRFSPKLEITDVKYY